MYMGAALLFHPMQLAHIEPLLLGDKSFTYAVEFKSPDEERFPELFAPQVCHRPSGPQPPFLVFTPRTLG